MCSSGVRFQGALVLDRPGKPWQNGVAESFNGKFRDECLSLEWFRTRAEAKVIIESWRNAVRPHSSLGYLTPNEFAARQTKNPAPRQATGRGAAVFGASAPRPVAPPAHIGHMQQMGAVSS
jgi:putative transposase